MLLNVSGITKSFGGITAAVNVGFGVSEGSISALIGPNGAGKTTIFNLITGTLKPEKGAISLDGKHLVGLKPYQIAEAGVTRTFQNLQLFGDMTVLENVITGAYLKGGTGFIKSLFCRPGKSREDRMIKDEATNLLEEVGLGEAAGLSAATLPFGQQRLLEIARALASGPRLLLLDEPAAGLNSAETKVLAAYLKRLREKGLTMMLIEHDMDTVMEVADHVVVLNFGEVIAEGTPHEIQANPEVIKAYLGEDDRVA
ncbi:ABC transporter ATP-binding protein [Desulfoscipio sp. XC116]|uniref:ABC transporter ATP-binding protein n=1 Tax=Desulfoscipio sp. XC116 TaxID=3144975 RepID=UPI00325AE061